MVVNKNKSQKGFTKLLVLISVVLALILTVGSILYLQKPAGQSKKNDFGCWPPSCSFIPNPQGKQMCEDWKAGRAIQWPECSMFSGQPNCVKLCEAEKQGGVVSGGGGQSAQEAEAHQMSPLFSIEFKPGVEKADEEAFRKGFKIMDFYLEKWFGKSLTRKTSVIIDGASGDNKLLEENGGITVLFHTLGEEWQLVKDNAKKYNRDERDRIAAHEYVHLFQMSRGCVRSQRSGEKAKWFLEGSAEWLSYKAFAESGNLPGFNLEQQLLYPLRQMKANIKPLRTYEGEGRTESIYSYFHLAVNFLMKNRDIKTLENFCINLGKDQTISVAFQNAFGSSLDTFYSDFEKYYQNLME